MCKQCLQLMTVRVADLAARGADQMKMAVVAAFAADHAVGHALAALGSKTADRPLAAELLEVAVDRAAPGLHALRAERGNHAVHRQALVSVPRQTVEHGALLFCMIPHFAFPKIEIEIQIQIATNSIPRPPGFVKIFCANSCYPQRSIV